MVRENLEDVNGRIRAACLRSGRSPDSVRLVVVTKEARLDQAREAVSAGAQDIGENRVKDALIKREALGPGNVRWHLIGHLQTNKAKNAVKIFSLIHSVDSLRLAYIIDREAEKERKAQDILVEVNTSGEKSKFGIKPDELEGFLGEAKNLGNIRIKGLMTMAPLSDEAESSRPYFRNLKRLAQRHGLAEVSMGMTQDFEVAIEEGATMVRVGSAIFKR